MFENSLAQLAIVAAFVQKFISLVKPLYQQTDYQKYFDVALSIVVSALLCVSWQVDVFAVAGIALAPLWLGSAFTGVLAGLGSNVLNDVLVLLEMWKKRQTAETATATAVAVVATDAVEDEPKG